MISGIVTIDELFRKLYEICQRRFAELDAFLLQENPGAHQGAISHAQQRVLRLFDLRPGTHAEEVEADPSELHRTFFQRYGSPAGEYYLLRATDSAMSRYRQYYQRLASLALGTDTPVGGVIVPKPVTSGAIAKLADGSGLGSEARIVADHLEHFSLVYAHEMRVTYLPIGPDGLETHAQRQSPLSDISKRAAFPRILCANFPERTALPWDVELIPADGGWKHRRFHATFLMKERPSVLAELRSELRDLLQTANDEEIHVLVLPELSVPPSLRGDIEHHMRSSSYPLLVVAGSWHERDSTNSLRDWLNRAPVFGVNGVELGSFTKTFRFQLSQKEFARLASQMGDPGGSGSTGPVSEHIGIGDSGLVIDTGCARYGVAICIDALKSDALMNVYKQMGVNCMLVPSMSMAADRFKSGAKNFAELTRGVVCFSNTPVIFPDRLPETFRNLGSRVTVGFGRAEAIVAGSSPPARRASRELRPHEMQHAVLEPNDLALPRESPHG